MAKRKPERDLVRRLRASGIRKRAAELIADATSGRGKPAKQVRRVVDDLGRLLSDAENRVTGGSAKRSAAAKKGAKTRKLKAQRRSTAAKKAARTRAKSAR